jgi:hypothetical protein
MSLNLVISRRVSCVTVSMMTFRSAVEIPGIPFLIQRADGRMGNNWVNIIQNGAILQVQEGQATNKRLDYVSID